MKSPRPKEWLSGLYYLFATGLGLNGIFFLFSPSERPNPGDLPATAGGNQPGYVVLWLLLWLWTAVLIARSAYRNELRWSLIFAAPIVALVLASSLWSVSPGTTLYYGAILTANILVAYELATAEHPDFLLLALTRTLAICLVLSLLLLLVDPQRAAAERYGGGWLGGLEFNGVFPHKSNAGYYFGALFVAIVLGFGGQKASPLRVATGALAAIALLLTNSATGLASTVFLSMAFLAFRALRLRSPDVLVVLSVCCFAFALLAPYLHIGAAAEFVGRDSNLTGRSEIWPAGIASFLKRPVLGYGYYGFFYPGDFSPVWDVWNASTYFKTPHFHNSGLDIAVSLGVVGLFAYAVLFLIALSVVKNETLAYETRENVVALLLMMVLSSAFDFTLMFHNSFSTTILFYCFFASQFSYGRQPVLACTPLSSPHGSKSVPEQVGII